MLHEHVQTVVPTTYFASTRTLRQTPWRHTIGDTASRDIATALSSRNDDDKPDGDTITVTPSDLRSRYRTVAYVPAATGQNELGIAGFQNDYPSPVDLAKFMTRFLTDAVVATFTVAQINNAVRPE